MSGGIMFEELGMKVDTNHKGSSYICLQYVIEFSHQYILWHDIIRFQDVTSSIYGNKMI